MIDLIAGFFYKPFKDLKVITSMQTSIFQKTPVGALSD